MRKKELDFLQTVSRSSGMWVISDDFISDNISYIQNGKTFKLEITAKEQFLKVYYVIFPH